MKRLTFLWGALLFMVTLLMLYMMLDTLNMGPRQGKMDTEMLSLLESKLSRVEQDMNANRLVVQQIRAEMGSLLQSQPGNLQQVQPPVVAGGQVAAPDSHPNTVLKMEMDKSKPRKGESYTVQERSKGPNVSSDMCQWVSQAKSKADINMHNLLSTLAFDNPNGGAWTQGWKVTYPKDRWTANNKLKVILVPHTHCDPGWVKTYEVYYRTQTKRILDSFVGKLEESHKLKFMFTEISYFSWWWSEIDDSMRQRVKKFIASGQFEISTGGWVMTDEANAHYYAMLDQLIEGHQWLNSTLGYVPKSGWSIDPFGYSSTMAYLLKRSNFNSMLIQRVHYAIKKHLASNTQLEFMWRQHWDTAGTTDMYTHMMPFYSYDIPHTCGPEPAVCCQFDFRRLPGSPYRCPWHFDPKAITPLNVAERTQTILDQWKKKATLYKTNVVLVPLGDDFRYQDPEEFDLQFDNYEKIFRYLQENPELGAEASFGTLSDYFAAVYEETKTNPGHSPPEFPSLSGDFFSYADRDDHYWSGYYTSRPLQKNLDRVLEHNLRSAEIIFSLSQARARQENLANFPSRLLARKLKGSRRALALFQHHDGITGTAKNHVVEDYGKRLLEGLHEAKRVVAACSAFLLHEDKKRFSYSDAQGLELSLDETRENHASLPEKPVLKIKDIGGSAPVILYNPLAQPRIEIVSVHTDWPHVKVTGPDGGPVHSQVEPVWHEAAPSRGVYSLKFVVNVTGLAVVRYLVQRVEAGEDHHNHIAEISLLNKNSEVRDFEAHIFPLETKSDDSEFTLDTKFLRASFSGITGRLKSVTSLQDGTSHKSELEFIQYSTRAHRDKSGAYLFLPDGDARPLVSDRPSVIRIVKGPLGSEVTIFTRYIQHTVRLHNSPGIDGASVEISNIVDIRGSSNLEVGMRLHTGVRNSEQTFYSDLNGFQMQKRKYYSKLTLQGNVYPMPTMAYLQDEASRVSVVSSQSSGVANLVPGAIDVMFDRRLNQDDNRGLGQGVMDNHPTPSHYRLLFETRHTRVQESLPETSFPSLLGQMSSLGLIHPMYLMPHSGQQGQWSSLLNQVELMRSSLPCEMHLLNLRQLLHSSVTAELDHIPRESNLLLVRHLPSDCSFPTTSLTCSAGNGQVNPATIFAGVELRRSTITSLTMTSDLAELKPGTAVQVPPMEILAVKVELS